MAERFKAPVLKTDDGQPSASSNLAPTANLLGRRPLQIGGSGIRIGNGGAVAIASDRTRCPVRSVNRGPSHSASGTGISLPPPIYSAEGRSKSVGAGFESARAAR